MTKDFLTESEKQWLYSRGGRDASDVYFDENFKKYIFMHNGYGEEIKVYIPKNFKFVIHRYGDIELKRKKALEYYYEHKKKKLASTH